MSEDGDRAENDSLDQFEQALGHCFADRNLLRDALRHASYANETTGQQSNERLEFLGDAVIALVVSKSLYLLRPDWQEGELTRGLHNLVDKKAFVALARSVKLGPHLKLGRTEQQSGGADKNSILANAMEAVVGALYLDGGLTAVEEFMLRIYGDDLSLRARAVERDPKTRLQEATMARHGEFPAYEIESDSGIEGGENRFSSRVLIQGEVYGRGVGRTKRGAEFEAAEIAWKRFYAESDGNE